MSRIAPTSPGAVAADAERARNAARPDLARPRRQTPGMNSDGSPAKPEACDSSLTTIDATISKVRKSSPSSTRPLRWSYGQAATHWPRICWIGLASRPHSHALQTSQSSASGCSIRIPRCNSRSNSCPRNGLASLPHRRAGLPASLRRNSRLTSVSVIDEPIPAQQFHDLGLEPMSLEHRGARGLELDGHARELLLADIEMYAKDDVVQAPVRAESDFPPTLKQPDQSTVPAVPRDKRPVDLGLTRSGVWPKTVRLCLDDLHTADPSVERVLEREAHPCPLDGRQRV